MYKYFPHTDNDLKAMLERVGVDSMDALYAQIPENIRFRGDYKIPSEMSEMEVRQLFEKLGSLNKQLTCFAGMGVYDHYTPAVIPQLLQRSEFLTSYTPYQAEISQGTLHYIFEYQSMMAELTGMDVSNASMYDGTTAAAEAMMMAVAANKKARRVLISGAMNPLTVKVMTHYAHHQGIDLYALPIKNGVTDLEDLKAELEETPELFVGGPTRNISAGMLTAGEVNDFAKWNLWPMVRDSILGEFIDEWKIAPRERYTVQVVTKKGGYPIASQDVSLIDGNGNTLFQAVTDNTGKAELWGELIKNEKLKIKNDLRIRVGDYVAEAQSWQTVVLDEPCDVSDAVDVMFVFDATGSMGDELRYLQAEMRDVIARAKEATGGLEIRTGAVVYRDHHYDEYLTRISRLTDDISVTQQFIDRQEANGGGDYPEAVPEALMAALNSGGFNSNARARIVFLVLDAPCHQDSATIALLHEQILNAAAMGVRIVPVVCSGLGKSGEYLMRSIALTTNGTSFFLTDDSGIGHTHLKPATDSLKVEHLNDMLVRTIVEFSYMPNCEGHWTEETDENENDQFVPNPFEISDLELMEIDVTDSPTTLYLVDISGKLITVYEGRLEEAGDAQLAHLPLPQLSTGVYFVKAFYNGQWHTKKILVH